MLATFQPNPRGCLSTTARLRSILWNLGVGLICIVLPFFLSFFLSFLLSSSLRSIFNQHSPATGGCFQSVWGCNGLYPPLRVVSHWRKCVSVFFDSFLSHHYFHHLSVSSLPSADSSNQQTLRGGLSTLQCEEASLVLSRLHACIRPSNGAIQSPKRGDSLRAVVGGTPSVSSRTGAD